ncbi:MAG: response regulator [Deltaproteobacteria bacterium]|nr:response regulator [Deltaproteobacteria bacterium]NIS76776.1 response regulator [Deltaproteobacteria bacterium]
MKSKGRVFILDDDELIVTMIARSLKKSGFQVQSETTTENIIDKIAESYPDVILLDISLPGLSGMEILEKIHEKGIDTQVVMLTADDTAETAIKAMKLGAADYLTKPFNMEEMTIILNKIIEKERLKDEVGYLRKIRSQLFEAEIIGQTPRILELKEEAARLAEAHVDTVLITGESGTGKELFARHLHRSAHSGQAARCVPFIAVNCTALPDHLIESELFGYVKGAFTDAKSDSKGMFELANGGTILLDEIGDMKENLQGKLLRVLEQRSVRRLGGKSNIPIETTVIATTNRNIADAVERGAFRKDLFYRLNTFSLHIPPLRERREDIPSLAGHFLSLFARRYSKKSIAAFSPEAELLLSSYDWPGNVRELANVIERMVVLKSAETILPEHISFLFDRKKLREFSKDRFILPEKGLSLEELEKDLLIQALERAGNNKAQAAKLLDITYDTLRYQIKKYGLQ